MTGEEYNKKLDEAANAMAGAKALGAIGAEMKKSGLLYIDYKKLLISSGRIRFLLSEEFLKILASKIAEAFGAISRILTERAIAIMEELKSDNGPTASPNITSGQVDNPAT